LKFVRRRCGHKTATTPGWSHRGHVHSRECTCAGGIGNTGRRPPQSTTIAAMSSPFGSLSTLFPSAAFPTSLFTSQPSHSLLYGKDRTSFKYGVYSVVALPYFSAGRDMRNTRNMDIPNCRYIGNTYPRYPSETAQTIKTRGTAIVRFTIFYYFKC
jgi:hypothetical protein